jgi:hypothetical protein
MSAQVATPPDADYRWNVVTVIRSIAGQSLGGGSL